MAINLKTEEGFEFSFDTVEELMEFTQRMNAVTESTSDEGPAEDENEVPETEPKVEVGDKVRIVSADDGTDTPYHYHDDGSVGIVIGKQELGRIEVEVDGKEQYLLPHHYEKVESLGKDANGEDLYKGDFVTGTEGNGYGNTNDKVVMEVLGDGESYFSEKANIKVKIVGYCTEYNVDSTRFIKLSDNLDEAKEKFDEIKGEGEERMITSVDSEEPKYNLSGVGIGVWVDNSDIEHVDSSPKFQTGDTVRVVGNANGHRAELGEVREIKEIDSIEPKYNLSDVRSGYWASTSDIEHGHSSPKFQSGDVVKVTESFEDVFGDRVTCGAVYNYDENLGFGEPFVGSVFLGDNEDKIELVCRAQDRLDK